jgi:ribonuclease R
MKNKKALGFREVTTFTIDPEDAKDFDDAISFRKLEDGMFEIGVHIADVTHYIAPNSILDQEAFDRATSVYLVDRTVPMLPERLSNELCSLRPREDKLTFAAVFEMDEKGKIRKNGLAARSFILMFGSRMRKLK